MADLDAWMYWMRMKSEDEEIEGREEIEKGGRTLPLKKQLNERLD